MGMLSKEEKEELKYFANSSKLREDMQRLAETKYNPFLINGNVDADKILEFLTEYNCFIRLRAENHGCKPVDECRKVHYGEMSLQHVGGGPRRPLALPRGRREAAAGFSGTTAVKPWGSITMPLRYSVRL